MLIRMATLARAPNGDFICRKCIPADVREAYARQYRVSWEDRLRVPAGTPGRVATARCAEWSAEVDTRIAGLRAALRDEGQPLNSMLWHWPDDGLLGSQHGMVLGRLRD
jgi:hypothetical protein